MTVVVSCVTANFPELAYAYRVASQFTVFRKMEKGELLKVGNRPSRQEAEKFIATLKRWWPAEYIIEEALH